MSVIIKPKRSESAGAPTAGDLAVGELALNFADTTIYSKKSDGTIVSFVTSTTTPAFFSEEVDLGDLATATNTYDMASLTGGSPSSGGGIALTDLSIGTEGTASGDGAISYNSSTGVFTYTPPDLSTYASSSSPSFTGTITQGPADYYTKQYVLYGTTTNATETEILIGGSTRIPVPTDTTLFYEVSIVARRTDATGESGSWHLKGCVDNFSDTVADVGNVYEIAVAQDDVGWSVDVRADNTNDAINVFVTGAASKTIRWTAIVKTTEVAQ